MNRYEAVRRLNHELKLAEEHRIELTQRVREMRTLEVPGVVLSQVEPHGVWICNRVYGGDELRALTQFLVDCIGETFTPTDFSQAPDAAPSHGHDAAERGEG